VHTCTQPLFLTKSTKKVEARVAIMLDKGKVVKIYLAAEKMRLANGTFGVKPANEK
jgi:hypothetical protein